MTKTEKLLTALQNGERLTTRQIRARFGLKNPTAAITHLRQEGYAVFYNKRKTMSSFYKLGKPTRAVVAAGYKALASNS